MAIPFHKSKMIGRSVGRSVLSVFEIYIYNMIFVWGVEDKIFIFCNFFPA
ncbi:hypothetical protein H8356DRAFT_1437150 [Neocallimastix lanati (nom. inval.)]|nr:hypothetical protein H8356DRAFT_1437150 [Neocallimastix sp. JGI-2020a]